jgi:hypothetical protein
MEMKTYIAADDPAGDLPDERVGLADRIARWTAGRNKLETPISGLNLHQWATTTEPTSYMLPPSICLIGQGRKRLCTGSDCLDTVLQLRLPFAWHEPDGLRGVT